MGRTVLPKCMIKKGAKGPHDLLVNIKYFLVFHAQIIAIIDCFYVILQLFAAVRFFVRYTTTLIGVCGPRCSTGQGWSALMLSYYMRYYVMLCYVMLRYSTLCFVTLYYNLYIIPYINSHSLIFSIDKLRQAYDFPVPVNLD